MPTKKISIENADHALAIFGHEDSHLRLMESKFKVHVYVKRDRGTGDIALVLRGPQKRIDEAMQYLGEQQNGMTGHHAEPGNHPLSHEEEPAGGPMPDGTLMVTYNGKPIVPKTENQKLYVEAMKTNDLVVSIGPAGTGKTFLAVAYAVKCLKAKTVSRIVLTRPVVEAGEKLGFLPGDLYEKVYPYLKPIYDCLFYLLGPEKVKSLQVTETIEVAPLAYMRGRTMEDAFVILDEAQNATNTQLKMFLTRMGFGSKMVVTGDITQIDLEHGSGLAASEEILAGIDGVRFVRLNEADVVRHPLVRQVIRAYENWESKGNPPRHGA